MRYPTTPKTLIDRLKAGEEIAWEEFDRRYRPVIVDLGQLKGLTPGECEELAQDALLRLFNRDKVHRFQPGIARFRTWFGEILKGLIIDILRRRKPTVDMPPEYWDAQPASDSDAPDLVFDVALREKWWRLIEEDALLKLKQAVKDETYSAFDLYVRQGRPIAEVSKVLGISRPRIYLAKTRCLKLLRAMIEQAKTDDPELGVFTGEF